MFRIVNRSLNNSWVTTRGLSSVKEAREARRAQALGKTAPSTTSSRIPTTLLTFAALAGAVAVGSYEVRRNPEGALGSAYRGSAVEKAVSSAYEATFGEFNTIFEPAQDRLIPEWPTAPCYGNPPPGTPAPPLLVLDLEKTLVGSTYDAKHGWRHVKRPGLAKFIKSLSQYYEIVLFSENDMGVAQDIFMSIDPDGACHKLGSAAAEMRGSLILKRLDLMGRDLSKVILVDDSPESAQLFPRNTLYIKPFTNIADTTDRALDDLIPLLQALVHDDVADFRDSIDRLGTHDAEEAATEYKMRLAERKQREMRRRNVGLGGVIRSQLEVDRDADDTGPRSTILSPSQIVGGLAPGTSSASASSFNASSGASKMEGSMRKNDRTDKPATKKQGKLFQWLEASEKEKEAHENLKREKMNELYMQRMHEKAKQENAQKITQSVADDDDDF